MTEQKCARCFIKQILISTWVSLMGQYIPFGEAKDIKPINRKITKREYDKVLDYILESGFQNVYFQQSTFRRFI